jgi:hypothetical protein
LLQGFVLPAIAWNKSIREAKKADDQEDLKENRDSESKFVAKFSCQKSDKLPIYALIQ